MEFIESNQLVNCTGTVISAQKIFTNRRIIVFYFGASWSSACRQFLKKLREIYEKSKEMHLKLEIIYVSMDHDSESMMTSFAQRHGGWYALAFGDPAIWVLKSIYGISEIPSMVVLGKDGEVISLTGMADYEKYGMDVLVAWNTVPPK